MKSLAFSQLSPKSVAAPLLQAAIKRPSPKLRRVLCHSQADEVAEPAQLEAVEAVKSARLIFDEEGRPTVQYLACWKSDGACTWEPSINLSEDLVRDFEESFWAAVKKGDEAFVKTALEHGPEVMASMVDEDSRSALHFAAALNNKVLVQLLLDAGADPNLRDRDGYSPLHMAAGYLHNESVNCLLAGGADPTCKDRSGRDIVGLIESLRENMQTTAAMQPRIRLEEVSKALTMYMYEDALPKAVLNTREIEGVGTQYLVQWEDGSDDTWVDEAMISEEVLEDFKAGLEYAEGESLLDVRRRGFGREYLVRWKDSQSYPDTWESEDNLPRHLITQFTEQRKAAHADAKSDQSELSVTKAEQSSSQKAMAAV